MSLLSLDTKALYTVAQDLDVAQGTYDIKAILGRFHEQVENEKSPFHSGYRKQILAREGLSESKALAQDFRKKFKNLVVLGIGGSALGARAIYEALRHTIAVKDRRELRIIDNLDPIFFANSIEGLDWKETAVVVISKSGGTVETMSQLAWILETFETQKIDFRKHVVAITDPKSGALLEWAQKEKLATLFVPPSVGGRFSVFTPVGIFPLAFAGLDVEQLFSGAEKHFKEQSGITKQDLMKLSCRLKDFESAGYLAHVLFSYASVMREAGAWFVQLWGESLGKIHPRGYRTGSFPITAIGATDQHSLLQLLMEGPKKAVISFVKIQNWEKSPYKVKTFPAAVEKKLKFAVGKSFEQILNAEEAATLQALANEGRPVFETSLQDLGAQSVGAWLAYAMDLTSMTGAVHGVNPYDQPGVELGKRILPELLK